MRLLTPTIIAFLLTSSYTSAESYQNCLPPAEPYQYKVDKKLDPELYDFTRKEFQTYLESMEVYLRCLERERAIGLRELQTMFKLFRENYGNDAVFKYNQHERQK